MFSINCRENLKDEFVLKNLHEKIENDREIAEPSLVPINFLIYDLFLSFLRNLRPKIQKLTKFHEKAAVFILILYTLKGTNIPNFI